MNVFKKVSITLTLLLAAISAVAIANFTFAFTNNTAKNEFNVTYTRPDTMTVVLNANGGTLPTPADGTTGVALTFWTGTYEPIWNASHQPTRTGYSFVGYSTSSSATSADATYNSSANVRIVEQTTLYAVWSANTYTVALDLNGKTATNSPTTTIYEKYDTGYYRTNTSGTLSNQITTSSAGGLVVPTATGYTFNGYFTTTTGGTKYIGTDGKLTGSASTSNFSANGTLYAQWTANTYTVTLDKQNGTGGTNSVTATYGSAMPSATAPSRTGYTFGGYYDEENGGGTQYYTNAMASARTWNKTSNTTLYAKWTINTYSITVTVHTSRNGDADNAPYLIAMLDTSGTDYVSSDVTWFGTDSSVTVTIPNVPYGTTGDIKLKWGRTTNRIYTLSSTALTSTQSSYTAKDTYTTIKSSYTQGDSNGSATAYAKQFYQMSYNANGGSGTVPATQYKPYGSNYTVSSTAPTTGVTNFTFMGYGTSSSATSTVSNYSTEANQIFYAVWKRTLSANFWQITSTSAVTKTHDVYNGDSATTWTDTTPTVSTVTGYTTVVGWGNSTSATSATLSSNASSTITNGANYYAVCKTSITLTYAKNGKTTTAFPSDTSADRFVTANRTASPTYTGANFTISSTTPTATGYTFSSWSASGGATGSYAVSGSLSNIASNVTLTAQWTANRYEITFNANSGSISGGTLGENNTMWVVYETTNKYTTRTGSSAAAFPSATKSRTGYTVTFNGWYTAQSGGSKVIASNGTVQASVSGYTNGSSQWVLAEAKTLYAQFTETINTYTLTVNYNNQKSSTATNMTVSAPSGYTVSNSGSVASGSITVSHTYDTTEITVTIGSASSGYYVAIGEDCTTSSSLNSTTYGWTPNGSDTETINVNIAQKYTITYGGNGSTSGSTASQDKVHGTNINTASNGFSKTGYSFSKWNTKSGGDGTAYTAGASYSANASATLYAQWTANKYSVTLAPNGGSMTIYYNSTNTSALTANTTVYAQYDSTTLYYKVGEVYHAITKIVSSRTGYTHNGYYLSSTKLINATDAYVLTSSFTSSISGWSSTPVFTASWTAKTYTVTLDKQSGTGGTGSVTATYDADMPTTSVTAPTRTGYDFGGYYDGTGGSGTQYYTSAMASARTWNKTSDTTLYAKWTINTYTLTVKYYSSLVTNATNLTIAQADSTVSSASIAYNASATVKHTYSTTALTVSLGRANGDYTYYMGHSENTTSPISTSSTTNSITYSWTPDENGTKTINVFIAQRYSISYNNNTGSGTMSTTYKVHGTDVSLAANGFTKTGYSFAGWKAGNASTGTAYAGGATYSANSSTTMYAQWTANTYTVTFDKQSGAGGSGSVTATYDSTMPSATAPSRMGYTFGGYYDATGGSGTQYYTSAMASARTWNKTSDTTLYAKWTANSYTLTADAQSGSIATTSGWTGTGASATKSVTYKSTYGTLPTVSRTGYTLSEWNLLPAGYQGLTYIQATGSQWIDTGYAFGNNSTPIIITADVTCDTASSGNYCLAGCGDSVWNGPVMMNFCSGYMEWGANGYARSGTYAAGTRYTYQFVIYAQNHQATQNDTTFLTRTTGCPTSTTTLAIGCFHYATSSTTGFLNGKIYSFAVYSGGSVVRNFIPCKNTSNNKVGLWDTINGVFYSDAAGGNFTAGDTVSTTITSSSTVNVAGNHKIYARWAAKTYSVTFAANSGSMTTSGLTNNAFTATYDTVYRISSYVTSISRTGYTFAGWKVTAGLDNSVAKYGTTSSPDTQLTDSTLMNNTDYFKNINAASNAVTLTAQWTNNNYVVTFAGNSGTITKSNLLDANYKFTASYDTVYRISSYVTAISRTGYTFAGWKVTTGLNNSVAKYGNTDSPSTQLTSTVAMNNTDYFKNINASSTAVTIEAQWTIKTYSITVTVHTSRNGDAGNAPQLQAILDTSGTDYTSTAETWVYTASSVTLTIANVPYNTSGSLKVRWTTTTNCSYIISTSAITTAQSSTTAKDTYVPINASYTQGDSNGTATAYAKQFYQMSYNANGGSGTVPATQYKPYGSNYTVSSTAPTTGVANFTFMGYGTSSSATSTVSTYSTEANQIFYAVWKRTLSANFWQITSTSAVTKTYDVYNGDSATTWTDTTPTVSTVTGYTTVVGWGNSTSATSVTLSSNASSTITNGANYYAVCKTSISLTYAKNGKTTTAFPSDTSADRFVTANKTASPTYTGANFTISSTTPTATGYTFSSWSASGGATGSYAVSGSLSNIASNVTLTAQWTINSYTLTLYKGSANLINATSMSVATTTSYGKINNATYSYDPANGGTVSVTSTSTSDPYVFTNIYAPLTAGTTYRFYMTAYNSNGTTLSTDKFQIIAVYENTWAAGNYHESGAKNGPAFTYTFTAGKTGNYYFDFELENSSTGTWIFKDFWLGVENSDNYTTVTQNYATTYTMSASRTGQTLNSWIKTSGAGSISGNTYTFGAGDGVVNAHYTINTPRVTYAVNNANYGSVNRASLVVYYGSAVSSSNNTVTIAGTTVTATVTNATGYTTTFSSWTNGTGTITADTTITANFSRSANNYTLTLNGNNGTVNDLSGWTRANSNTTSSKSIAYDSAIGSMPSASRAGYDFAGWFTGQSSGTQIYTSTIYNNTNLAASDYTLYAHWTNATYTITLSLNGKTATNSPTTAVYEKYNTGYYLEAGCTNKMATNANPVATVPTVTGYTFNGYWTTSSGGTQYISSTGYLTSSASTTNFTANGTLYARYTANKYSVTLNPEGGSVSISYNGTSTSATTSNVTVYAQYDSSKLYYLSSSTYYEITAITTSKTGYTHTGYFTEASGGVKIINASTACTFSGGNWTSTSNSAVYHAQWSINTYTLTVKYYSSLVTNATNLTIAQADSTVSSGSIAYNASATVKHTYSTTALTVTLGAANANAGSGINYYLKVNADVTTSNASTNSGTYSWTPNDSGTYTINVYIAQKYTISYNKNGASASGSMTATNKVHGTNVTLTSNGFTAPTGKHFDGWRSGNASSGTFYSDGATYPTDANVTMYAQWAWNTYTVTFAANSGTMTTSGLTNNALTATYDTVYRISTYVTAMSRANYDFLGWKVTSGLNDSVAKHGDTNNPSTQILSTTVIPHANYFKNITATNGGSVTLTAQWQLKAYTITISVTNGSGGTTKTIGHGSTVSVSGNTISFSATDRNSKTDVTVSKGSATGYTIGDTATWSPSSGTITGTATYTATFSKTANTYTVTLNKQDGTGGSGSVTATYDSAMPTSSVTAPTRTGYDFGGYYDGTGGTGTQYYTAAMASARTWNKTSDTTLYAKWTIKTYTLTVTYKSQLSSHTTNLTASATGATISNSGSIASGSMTISHTYQTSALTVSFGRANSSYNYFINTGSACSTSSSLNSKTYSDWIPSTNASLDVYIAERYTVTYHQGSYTSNWSSTFDTPLYRIHNGSAVSIVGDSADCCETEDAYRFNGWTTTVGGLKGLRVIGEYCKNWSNSSYSTNANLDLYPVYAQKFDINMNTNGGTGGSVEINGNDWYVYKDYDQTITIVQPTKTGYQPDIFAAEGPTYANGNEWETGLYDSTATLPAGVTGADIDARFSWDPQTYTITFNTSTNGGTIPSGSYWTGSGTSATKSVTYNETYGTLPTPTKASTTGSATSHTYTIYYYNGEWETMSATSIPTTYYSFKGWYTSSSGGTKITSSSTHTLASGRTLYAQWDSSTSYTPSSGTPTFTGNSWKTVYSGSTVVSGVDYDACELNEEAFYAGRYPQLYVGSGMNSTLESAYSAGTLFATGRSYHTYNNTTLISCPEYYYEGDLYVRLASAAPYGYFHFWGVNGDDRTLLTNGATYWFKVDTLHWLANHQLEGVHFSSPYDNFSTMVGYFDDECGINDVKGSYKHLDIEILNSIPTGANFTSGTYDDSGYRPTDFAMANYLQCYEESGYYQGEYNVSFVVKNCTIWTSTNGSGGSSYKKVYRPYSGATLLNNKAKTSALYGFKIKCYCDD